MPANNIQKRLERLEQQSNANNSYILFIDDIGHDEPYREQQNGENLKEYNKYLKSQGMETLIVRA